MGISLHSSNPSESSRLNRTHQVSARYTRSWASERVIRHIPTSIIIDRVESHTASERQLLESSRRSNGFAHCVACWARTWNSEKSFHCCEFALASLRLAEMRVCCLLAWNLWPVWRAAHLFFFVSLNDRIIFTSVTPEVVLSGCVRIC